MILNGSVGFAITSGGGTCACEAVLASASSAMMGPAISLMRSPARRIWRMIQQTKRLRRPCALKGPTRADDFTKYHRALAPQPESYSEPACRNRAGPDHTAAR